MKFVLAFIIVAVSSCYSHADLNGMPRIETYEEACQFGFCSKCVKLLSHGNGERNTQKFCRRLTNMSCCHYAVTVSIQHILPFLLIFVFRIPDINLVPQNTQIHHEADSPLSNQFHVSPSSICSILMYFALLAYFPTYFAHFLHLAHI